MNHEEIVTKLNALNLEIEKEKLLIIEHELNIQKKIIEKHIVNGSYE